MCLCRRMSFERLRPLARERGWDLDTLIRETGCGDQCVRAVSVQKEREQQTRDLGPPFPQL